MEPFYVDFEVLEILEQLPELNNKQLFGLITNAIDLLNERDPNLLNKEFSALDAELTNREWTAFAELIRSLNS